MLSILCHFVARDCYCGGYAYAQTAFDVIGRDSGAYVSVRFRAGVRNLGRAEFYAFDWGTAPSD